MDQDRAVTRRGVGRAWRCRTGRPTSCCSTTDDPAWSTCDRCTEARLADKGLYVELHAYETQAFLEMRELHDPDGRWRPRRTTWRTRRPGVGRGPRCTRRSWRRFSRCAAHGRRGRGASASRRRWSASPAPTGTVADGAGARSTTTWPRYGPTTRAAAGSTPSGQVDGVLADRGISPPCGSMRPRVRPADGEGPSAQVPAWRRSVPAHHRRPRRGRRDLVQPRGIRGCGEGSGPAGPHRARGRRGAVGVPPRRADGCSRSRPPGPRRGRPASAARRPAGELARHVHARRTSLPRRRQRRRPCQAASAKAASARRIIRRSRHVRRVPSLAIAEARKQPKSPRPSDRRSGGFGRAAARGHRERHSGG